MQQPKSVLELGYKYVEEQPCCFHGLSQTAVDTMYCTLCRGKDTLVGRTPPPEGGRVVSQEFQLFDLMPGLNFRLYMQGESICTSLNGGEINRFEVKAACRMRKGWDASSRQVTGICGRWVHSRPSAGNPGYVLWYRVRYKFFRVRELSKFWH